MTRRKKDSTTEAMKNTLEEIRVTLLINLLLTHYNALMALDVPVDELIGSALTRAGLKKS